MLEEPIYEYVRGEGWVINPDNYLVTKTSDDIPISLRVVNCPKPGERYYEIHEDSLWLRNKNGLNKPKWNDYVTANSYRRLELATEVTVVDPLNVKATTRFVVATRE